MAATAAAATTLLAAGCGNDDAETTSASAETATTAVTETAAGTGAGDGDVPEFAASEQFWCLDGDPVQAQTTIGWSVPGAEAVAVFLDGERLHSGIRERLPFSVLAGDAPGIGTTVVFPCEPDDEHEIEIRWRLEDSSRIERTVTVTKATGA